MDNPRGWTLSEPGFPSIAVNYAPTNDLFYSGHIGLPLLFLFEYARKGHKYMVIPCLISSIIEGFMMLTLRGHYTIDLIFGVIFAHYFYKISLKMDPLINKYFCCSCSNCSSLNDKNVGLKEGCSKN